MPSPYDVIVVGSGPAGGTAARYAARRGLKVLLVDKRKEIGVPVQCGEYVAHNEEIRSIFPDVEGLEEIMAVPYHVREVDTHVIRIWSAKGRRYEVPCKGFAVRTDRMDQGNAARAAEEGGFSNWTDMFFGNLAPGGYAWIIPKAHCANVGLGTWQYFHGNLQSLFDRFVRSRGLEPGKATGGFVPVMGPPPRTVKDNAMLVGDAAGMVMATNGGGNNVAMIAGRIAGLTAADHLLDGTPLAAYATRWPASVGGPLAQGVRIKKLADRFFGSDRLLEAAMVLIGRRRMARAIRCQRLLLPSAAKVL